MGIIPQLVVNSIIAGAIYTLIALGFNLIFGATKFLNMAHGVVAAVGAYTVFFLAQSFGVSAIFSAIIGILVAGGFGVLTDVLVYQPLRRRHASQFVLLVASLGVFTVLQALIAMIFTSQFKTLSIGNGVQQTYNLFGGIITTTQIVLVLCAVGCTMGLLILLNKTRFGRAIKAVSDDEEVAKIVGINTDRIIRWLFFIGSAIAGLGGILVGYDTGIEPTMGMWLLMSGVVSGIIGGIGSIGGAFVGSFFLGFIENFGIWHISGEWKAAIVYTVLILFLIFRPRGIFKK
jgi:branched-chain amino acid transport system permease protein